MKEEDSLEVMNTFLLRYKLSFFRYASLANQSQ